MAGLNTLGARLDPAAGPVRVVLAGAMAGVLTESFGPSRVTLDCDVLRVTPPERAAALLEAARRTAIDLGLPERWLNTDCARFAHLAPLGWEARAQRVGRFGALEVYAIARGDLLALKVSGAACGRAQDLHDARSMRPSAAELGVVEANIDRLEREDLDAREFKPERAILQQLRKEPM